MDMEDFKYFVQTGIHHQLSSDTMMLLTNQILGAVFLFLGFTATTFVRQLMTNFKLSKWPSV